MRAPWVLSLERISIIVVIAIYSWQNANIIFIVRAATFLVVTIAAP